MGLFSRIENIVATWATWDEAAGASAAFAAFRASAPGLLEGRYPTGTLGIDAGAYRPAAEAALREEKTLDEASARRFFRAHFVPLALASDREPSGPDSPPGFVTAYYEPEVEASPVRTERFRFPLYGKPDDLEKIDDVSRPPGLDRSFRFARRRPCGLLDEYPDRAAIEAGYLEGRGLEIAWLDDPVDAFFIHIQGSARLAMPDGSFRRVGYAAKTGHPFTAIGRVLVEEGALTLAEADMAGIRAWLARHPEKLRPLLNRNRSFIFFADFPVDDAALGPVGAAKVPLTPLASIAVDRELATYGVPYLVSAPDLAIEGAPFRRVCIAQDTGSAILGSARADIFIGSGARAGAIAGGVRHAARFVVLVPPQLAKTLAP